VIYLTKKPITGSDALDMIENHRHCTKCHKSCNVDGIEYINGYCWSCDYTRKQDSDNMCIAAIIAFLITIGVFLGLAIKITFR
jgi:hypothetical protein